ncbi:methyltransferase type 11 [Actinoplanes sp. NBRC 14428]|nr:methyltransferase type 11 [Actinoplanes sp. NBRC 14428]
MPTLNSPGESAEPHRHREMAESFGVDAELYDRARPRYPAELVRRVVAASPGPDVLDVGIGTGIVARQFREAGCRVLGVDADARMAERARRDGLEVEVAAFERWEPAGRRFDAVVAGQTWHWVDPVAGAEKAAAVLRPGGRLAVFWNAADPPPEVAAGLADVYRELMPELPPAAAGATGAAAYAAGAGRTAATLRGTGLFAEPEQWRFDWEQDYTAAQWLDHLRTSGALTRLPADRVPTVLATAGAALPGRFTVRYATVVATAAVW